MCKKNYYYIIINFNLIIFFLITFKLFLLIRQFHVGILFVVGEEKGKFKIESNIFFVHHNPIERIATPKVADAIVKFSPFFTIFDTFDWNYCIVIIIIIINLMLHNVQLL